MKRAGPFLCTGAFLLAVLGGCSLISSDKPPAPKFDDDGITAAVKHRLVADESKMLSNVDVETVSRIVYLTGTVRDEHAERRAAEIARSVDGVNKVVNDLDTE